MRSHFLHLTVVATIVVMGNFSWAQNQQQNVIKEMAVGVNGIYIPSTFNPHSDAYVVVNGLFPNGCYSLIEPKVQHVSTFAHEIFTMAKVKQGICLRVMVPFNKEIMVGKLALGLHTFSFISDDGTSVEKTVEIKNKQ